MSTKIAVVTGASRGLGKSMALHLAARGVGIVGTYRANREQAGKVAAEIRERGVHAAMLPLDCTDMASLERFVAELPAVLETEFDRRDVDFLVNNAGIGLHANFVDTTEAQFDEIVAVNLKAPFFLTQKLLPLIVDGGRILNVSSGLARFTIPGIGAYAATKGAIEVLTRYQAKELGARGIRVNVIAPGAIATDFSGGVVRDNADMNRMVAASIPLGRVGEADDVGGAVALLLSEDAGWINGTRIEVSGGQSL
jgi:NAD(P)-dependent dehydrogenase (short-subunit alcohol dehydrogenase family)